MNTMEESVFDELPYIPDAVERFDEFGFAVFKDKDRDSDERHHIYRKIELTDHQLEAWQDMLCNWSHTQLHAPERLRAYLKKGLPAHLRPQLWRNILGCKQLQEASTFDYQEHLDILRLQLVDLQISEYTLKEAHYEMWSENVKTPDEEARFEVGRQTLPMNAIRQIIVDVDRTFATHRLFMNGSSEAVEGKASLFRVLGIYALYNPEVGYCQGMSYLAGMLLMHMKDEEEAFWAMVALFEKPKYLTGYFDDSLSKIQEHALVFQKLLHQRMRNLDKHLTSLELNPLVFVTPWFMCLYTSFPCWDTVLAIWDLILLDGISTIFRVALSVLYLCQKTLLECEDMSNLLPRLLHPPLECMCYDTLMPMVWKTSVEKWEIGSLQGIVFEEKLKKMGLKRSSSRLVETTMTTAPQTIKRARLGSDKNNNDNDDVDSASTSSDSGSIFKRVISMFNPQRVLQDTTNNQSEQSDDQRSKVKVEYKVKEDVTVKQRPKVIQNRPRLRPRGPGGARPLTPGSSKKRTWKALSGDPISPESMSQIVWSTVGGSYQGIYSPGHGVIGHPFDTVETVLNNPFEPVVRFSKNRPEAWSLNTEEKDRVSPCTAADEERKGTQRRVWFKKHADFNFVKPKDPSPLAASDKASTQGQTSQNGQKTTKSSQGQGSQRNIPQSPNVASIYFRRRLQGCGNPLNVPTNRKLIGESARLQHSFKTFHTPTPLRRSQRLRLSSSPCPSSPEVELQFFSGTSQINTPDKLMSNVFK